MSKIFLVSSMAIALLVAGTVAAQNRPRELLGPSPEEMALIADPPAPPSEYWLGIGCTPVPPAVRAQLNLPEKQGLLVGGVAPESPAAKAGILQYDILLQAADKPLVEPRDLVQAVEAAKDGKLAIELIRAGQRQTIEATPTKRPEEIRRQPEAMPAPGDWETMQKWMERMGVGDAGEGHRPPLRFHLFGPGAIVPPGELVPLPPNMSIAISREGDQPTKIVVRRGDEKWEVTEKELDTLPADVRPHVERMLGRGPFGILGGAAGAAVSPGSPPEATPHGILGPPDNRLEKRLEAMEHRMDRLMQAMEKMTESRANPKAPEKPD